MPHPVRSDPSRSNLNRHRRRSLRTPDATQSNFSSASSIPPSRDPQQSTRICFPRLSLSRYSVEYESRSRLNSPVVFSPQIFVQNGVHSAATHIPCAMMFSQSNSSALYRFYLCSTLSHFLISANSIGLVILYQYVNWQYVGMAYEYNIGYDLNNTVLRLQLCGIILCTVIDARIVCSFDVLYCFVQY